jgi:hypothetical protein
VRRFLVASLAAIACAHGAFPPPPTGADDAAAREVLGRFAKALDKGRFDEAQALLSRRWRDAYTPGRLAMDYRGAPGAREALARVARLLASGEPLIRGVDRAHLGMAGAGRPLLVLEPDGWRVDALE